MSHLTIQQLVAQSDGELSGPSLTLVERHLSECEVCWHELELLAEQDALLASVVSIDPGDDFFEELAAIVEAEISGRKKPAPRPAAPPTATVRSAAPPAATPSAEVRPQPAVASPPSRPEPERVAARPKSEPVAPGPEPERVAAGPQPEPERERVAVDPAPEPEVEPAATNPLPELESEPVAVAPAPVPRPAPMPANRFDPPPAAEPQHLEVELVGAWTPPKPTLDDPFADLVLPPRSAAAPAVPAIAPRPPAPRAARPDPEPRPARRKLAAPARVAAPRVPDPPLDVTEGRRPTSMAPILIGVAAFIAGIIVAVVVTMRLTGLGGVLSSRPPENPPVAAQTVISQPVVAAPEPAPEAPPAEAPPVVQVEVPPAIIPVPAAAPAPSPPKVPARARRHTPTAAPSAADNAALNAPSTTMIPVHVIRTETVVPGSPQPAPAAAPAAHAAEAELGVLCGLVRDTDGHPVARAQVMMADVGVVVLTDRAGRFCLTAPGGERTLSVVALGFATQRRLVTLAKRTPELSVTLKSAAPFPIPH